jgi:hypothetical protein
VRHGRSEAEAGYGVKAGRNRQCRLRAETTTRIDRSERSDPSLPPASKTSATFVEMAKRA